ncbi:carbamoyl-phosphate synthase large subunit, partial [Streptomyces cavourensis]|uniref:carbamoyl-phosphate synthase large subunit n=2 Tax=Streptomyces TaxID=1883 RepID=UPI00397599E1
MPKRSDIQSVLVIGSGPIVIGQAAEFDYSGTQACRVLKAEGLRVVLVNSNPATIMTDPEIADATYVEPITPEFVEKIIAKERPDALLPTLGGQTALNTAISMHENGVLEKYGVELIGANVEAINKGEDRDLFKGVVEAVKEKIGYGESARSVICHSMDDVLKGVDTLGGYPVVVRPSFTMGGAGSGFAHDEEELRRIAGQGLTLSPTTEVLLEESILGWKEYELELMRDKNDNVVVVCSIENFDPMGVHTGDSITVAPAMTLTDREYQRLRDVGIAIIREVGVDTGGCNIQFAIDPTDGRVIVIEMNPRVSRSSALASKATGFPIAKIAAKLAVGYTLDEIPNDITEKTPASFEPTLDYVVVKAPRFAFEKFPSADSTLTTTMKSVGEAMAIGRNFTEALQKALRSLEKKGSQFAFTGEPGDKAELLAEAVRPTDGRINTVMQAIRAGATQEEVFEATKIDPWFVLDEIPNDITEKTPASFEPTLDYVVVKAPRFAFEKFPSADSTLTTTMKSVGEAMAIGRNFTEALQKALRSLEKKGSQFAFTGEPGDKAELLAEAVRPTDGRINTVMQAIRAGATQEEVFEATKIDPWFVDQLFLIKEIADELASAERLDAELLAEAKRHGFSDAQIGEIRGLREDVVREVRHALGVRPVYKTVDTCAAEFAAKTPYFYSSYDEETEVAPRTKPAVIILGSGPNRIGQGIEFDYSCVHASFALSDAGFETVMVNCNPETVSTDYDTSDRLYFEPLTLEDVLEIVHAESLAGPIAGVVVQLGGQTPLGLSQALKDNGVPVVGTSPEAIHAAEDRGAFGRVLAEAGLPAPKHGTATTFAGAKAIADEIGYPVLVRPSYVLGGRGMEIVYDEARLESYIAESTEISPTRPVLVDRFLDDAIEIDVDALYDGTELYLGGVMEHIEEAGIHSGDSACALPPITLGGFDIKRLRASTEAIAKGVGVLGLINIQFALSGDILYVLEANPRASRTVPFTSKATAVPLAKA